MNTTIYLCEDSFENILTAVYLGWSSRKGHSHVRLQLRQTADVEDFCNYHIVETDFEQAEKVSRSIEHKISREAWLLVYRASLSWDPQKADAIYRFLVGGFHYGRKVTQMLAEPAVQKIFELNRQVSNESHFFREFIHFDTMDNQILLSRIRPKSNVLPMIAPYFADRLSQDNFLLLDMERRLAAVHRADRPWFLTSLFDDEAETLLAPDPEVYRNLWKTFYHSIAIEERKTPSLHKILLPLRYRDAASECGS